MDDPSDQFPITSLLLDLVASIWSILGLYTVHQKKKAFLYTIYSSGTYTDMTPPNITGTLIF